MEHQHQHQQQQHHHPVTEADWAAMTELLELEGDVLQAYLRDVVAWIRRLAADRPRDRILDVGSGPGVATLALAQLFAGSDVTALDVSAALLARVGPKALDLGLADRVHTLQADLDHGWAAIDPVDVVWASMSLHHLADPDRVLGDIFATLRPGGLLAVAEAVEPMRFLPDDPGVGRPGLEDRCQAALSEELTDVLPHLGADWASRLARAGYAVVAERTFVIDLTPPLPASVAPYALGALRRLRGMLEGRLADDDLATLEILTESDGPDNVVRRDDLTVRTARTVWVAERP